MNLQIGKIGKLNPGETRSTRNLANRFLQFSSRSLTATSLEANFAPNSIRAASLEANSDTNSIRAAFLEANFASHSCRAASLEAKSYAHIVSICFARSKNIRSHSVSLLRPKQIHPSKRRFFNVTIQSRTSRGPSSLRLKGNSILAGLRLLQPKQI
jgi:hypothetical protein